MTGTIPQDEFFPLKNLEILHLDSNAFTGSIPEIWEHTRRLAEIRLENNQLTSTIPSTMGELKGLSKFLFSVQNDEFDFSWSGTEGEVH
jgi:Leucine-rich repeat (LRR) protein